MEPRAHREPIMPRKHFFVAASAFRSITKLIDWEVKLILHLQSIYVTRVSFIL